MYPLPPSANAALSAHPAGPLTPLLGLPVWSSVPNGLTPGPGFLSAASRIVFPSVVAGAILLGGGKPVRAIRGYTGGVAHPALHPAPHHWGGSAADRSLDLEGD